MSSVNVGQLVLDLDVDSTGAAADARREGEQIGNAMEAGIEAGLRSTDTTVDKHLSKASSTAGKHFASIDKVAKIAFGNIVAYATQSLTFGTAALVRFGLDTLGTLQGAQMGFEALTGSVEEAAKFMEQLKTTAKRTPFELPNLAETTRRILAVSDAVGLTGKTMDETRENVFGFVEVMGDLVSTFGGSQTQFDNAVLAVSQMGSQGKIAAQEMRQLNDALPGFNAWKQLANGMGISEEELRGLVKQGKILSKDALPILLKQMKEFPGSAGAMARASKTITGVFANLKDAIGIALADGLVPFADALANMFDPNTGTLFEELSSTFESFGLLVGDMLVGLTPLFDEFLGVVQVLMEIVGGVVRIVAPVIAGIVGPLLGIAKAISGRVIDRLRFWGDTIGGWWDKLQPIRDVVVDLLEKALKPLGLWADDNSEHFSIAADALIDFALAFGVLKAALAGISVVGSIISAIGGVIAAIPVLVAAAPIIAIVAAVIAVGAAAVVAYKKFQGFRDFIDAIATWFRNLWDGIWKWFEENWDNIVDVVTGIWDGIVDTVETAVGAISTAIEGIVTAWDTVWGAVETTVGAIQTAIDAVQLAWDVMWAALEVAAKPVIDFLRGLWAQYGDEVTGIVVGLRDLVVNAFNLIRQIVVTAFMIIRDITSGVFDIIRQSWDAVVAILSPIVSWFRDQLPGAIEFFKNVILVVWPIITTTIQASFDFLVTLIGNFIAIVTPIWQALWDGARIVVETVYNAIRRIIEGILQVIQGLIQFVAAILGGQWKKAWDAALKVVEGFWNILRGILETIIGFFQATWTTLTGLISAPFKAAWDVITNTWNGAKRFFSNIFDGIKDVWNAFARGFNRIRIPEISLGPWELPGPIPDIPGISLGPFDLPDLPIFDMGALVTKPTVGLLAANSQPEVIIPLSNPQRARQLAAQSGLTSQLTGTGSVITIDQANSIEPVDVDLLFQKAEAMLVLQGGF